MGSEYVRKTKDYWDLEGNYGHGWEDCVFQTEEE